MNNELQQKVIGWMREIFKNEKIHINSLEYNLNEGYAAEILLVNITLKKDDATEHLDLVVKKGLDDNTTNVSFPDSYINEIDVYSKFIPYLRTFESQKGTESFEQIPFCYGTILTNDDKIIIMDNLKAKGFRVNDVKKPLDLNHMHLVLEAYANFHALAMAVRDQESNIMDRFINTWNDRSESKIFKSLLAILKKDLQFSIQLYEQKNQLFNNKSHVIEKLKILEENIDDLFMNSMRCKGENYWALCHVDCWNNNYLLKYNEETMEPNKAVLIDWQFAIFASPLIDVTALLFYCGSRKELEHIDDLLMFYYNTLTTKLKQLGSHPEKCFPWEVCMSSFKRYAPAAIAGVPMSVKLRCETENVTDTAEQDESYLNGLGGEKLKEPDEFLEKIDEIFEFCITKGFI